MEMSLACFAAQAFGLEAAILLMVMGTTFLAPVVLRLVLAGGGEGAEATA